jgi:hypothetical protein
MNRPHLTSIGRINPTSQHHKREIRANNRTFDPDQTGNFTAPFPENPHQQHDFPFFCLFSGSPASTRQQSTGQPVLQLPQTIAVVVVESWCYANQSKLGEARESGSSAGGCDNPPLACKWLREVVHGRTVYGPKDGILLMTA